MDALGDEPREEGSHAVGLSCACAGPDKAVHAEIYVVGRSDVHGSAVHCLCPVTHFSSAPPADAFSLSAEDFFPLADDFFPLAGVFFSLDGAFSEAFPGAFSCVWAGFSSDAFLPSVMAWKIMLVLMISSTSSLLKERRRRKHRGTSALSQPAPRPFPETLPPDPHFPSRPFYRPP